jgi:hypothetical protein
MSVAELARASGNNLSNMRMVMRRMLALKLVHISGWTPKAWHVVPSPIYKEGDGTNAPPPLTNRGAESRHQAALEVRVPAGSNLVAFSEIVKAMKDAPTHRIDLAVLSGTNHDSICTLIRHMHNIRLIHVAGWERGNYGIPKQLMAWGDRTDKPRPPRLVRPKSGEQHRRRKQLRMLQAVAGVPWSPSASGGFMRQNKESSARPSFNLAEAACPLRAMKRGDKRDRFSSVASPGLMRALERPSSGAEPSERNEVNNYCAGLGPAAAHSSAGAEAKGKTMSTDTMSNTSVLRSDRRTVTQLLAAAEKDTDAVSVFMAGCTVADTEAAIFVVKGAERIAYLKALCERQGLLTDKPVTGPACNLQRPWEQPT